MTDYERGYYQGKADAMKTQEPVAWMYVNEDGECEEIGYGKTYLADFEGCTPLYTTPPQRPWVGLTDEEMRECAKAMDAEPLAGGWPELIKFARAVEDKLRSKNT